MLGFVVILEFGGANAWFTGFEKEETIWHCSLTTRATAFGWLFLS